MGKIPYEEAIGRISKRALDICELLDQIQAVLTGLRRTMDPGEFDSLARELSQLARRLANKEFGP